VAAPRHALSSAPLSLRKEFLRKALHLAATAVPVAYHLGVERRALVLVLAGTCALAFLLERLRRGNGRIAAVFNGIFGSLIRPHERRSITGATWLALSCLVAVTVLSRNAAIAALWCATVGDPAATIAGRWTTRELTQPADRDGKTLAGSLACAVASFAGVWMLAGYPPLIAGVIAVAATVAESMPVRVDDNVRVAAAAGAIAQVLA